MRALLVASLLFVPLVAADHTGPIDVDPAAHLFPDPNSVQDALLAAAESPHAELHQVGASEDGLPLRVLEYVAPGIPTAERVVTFIMSQQHGNEPAGTPALVDLVGRVAAGEFDDVLSNQVLLLMPQSNPDGAIDGRRSNENGTDINRDHVALHSKEAKALHHVLNEWDVHVAFDHHEYGGVGTGSPSPVRVYDWDITTMYPNHGNVREPTRQLAQRLNYEHIYPFVQERGYSIGDYGRTGVGVSGTPGGDQWVELQQTAGGPDPGILRNNYGLNNIVGLLIETLVSPDENPLHSFERRVGAHEAVMEAVLVFAHDEADALIEAKRTSERLNRESPPRLYMEGERSATLPEAFRASRDVAPTFALHGLPPGVPVDGGLVWNMDNGRAGLIAAALSSSSSRALEPGMPHRVVDDSHLAGHPDLGGAPQLEETAGERSVQESPLPLALVAFALIVAARRRT